MKKFSLFGVESFLMFFKKKKERKKKKKRGKSKFKYKRICEIEINLLGMGRFSCFRGSFIFM